MRLPVILALGASAGGWIATILVATAPHTRMTPALLPITIFIGFGAFLTAQRLSRQPRA
jgi:hypothetical protein